MIKIKDNTDNTIKLKLPELPFATKNKTVESFST